MTRILVKMPNWVGDCVMATPALALLKTALPDAQIDLLARPSVAGILEENPHKSAIIAVNERKLPDEIFTQLKSAGYDAITLFTNSLGSAWLARRLGIPRRVGFSREGRGLLLTRRLRYRPLEWQSPTPKPLSRRSIKTPRNHDPSHKPRHMVEYYLEIARATVEALGGDMARAASTDYGLVLPLSRASEEKVARLLRDNQIQGKTLIGINPGAAHGPAKRWPADYLARTVEMLHRPDWAIISTAAPNESSFNNIVETTSGQSIYRLGEQVTLKELPALISRLSVLVTNDSGPMHIAAARRVPTVAIFGPTDPPSTYPWQTPHQIMTNPVQCSPCFLEECPIDHRCMRGISSFQVAEAVLESLSQSSRWTPFTP